MNTDEDNILFPAYYGDSFTTCSLFKERQRGQVKVKADAENEKKSKDKRSKRGKNKSKRGKNKEQRTKNKEQRTKNKQNQDASKYSTNKIMTHRSVPARRCQRLTRLRPARRASWVSRRPIRRLFG